MRYKQVLTAALLACAFSLAAAVEAPDRMSEKAQACQTLRESGASGEKLAQSGCCSWHQGVCGCSGGRVTCCDGSVSPSCGCNKDDPPGTL